LTQPDEKTLSEADYDAAVQRWRNLTRRDEWTAYYDETLFPMSCARMRARGGEQERLRLLVVSVGTQAYAPTLAVLANPADQVVLLESPESTVYGEQVAARLSGDSRFVHVRIDPMDMVDIARKVEDSFALAGYPGGSEVGCDITGGRKTMSAALAGVAALNGWRMFYIEGSYEREKNGLSYFENCVELPNLFQELGHVRREQARTFASCGRLGAAARLMRELSAEGNTDDRKRLVLLRAGRALRRADWPGLKQRVENLESKLAQQALCRAEQSGSAELALPWIAARCQAQEGDRDSAQRTLRQAGLLSHRPVEVALEKNRLRFPELHRVLPEWDDLDCLCGRGLLTHWDLRGL
jgi:hypothetical protein